VTAVPLLLPALLALLLLTVPARAQACTGNTDCDDGNMCTDDICDANLGCLHADNGNACSDGNACTTADACSGGVCLGGPPAGGCTPCQAAMVLPQGGGTFTGTVTGTSTLAGGCGDSGTSPERVYRWTPASSGQVTIQTCNPATTYDSVVYLRFADCAGVEIGCNDDTPGCATASGSAHGSRVTATVIGGTTYFIVVDGYGGAAGTYVLRVFPPSNCGNGIREGVEVCDGADSGDCESGQCRASCFCEPPPGGQPDLVPEIEDVEIERDAAPSSADVAEGCAESTQNVDLLRFTVRARNDGNADLFFGDPQCPTPCSSYPLEVCGNPDFICSPADGHNHAHYANYARYDLLDPTSQAVVVGHKQGFCLRDSASCSTPQYSCSNQGITAGCMDIYSAGLGCQYLDITGIPPGAYTLRVALDPFGRIAELDETNNVVMFPVTIPSPNTTTTLSTTSTTKPSTSTSSTTTTSTTAESSTTSPTTLPPREACDTARFIPPAGGRFTGSIASASELRGSCGSADGGEAVFRWIPSRSGLATIRTCSALTSFDTVLYVRHGSCREGTETGCAQKGCLLEGRRGSRLQLPVTAGETYYIVVDGAAGTADRFKLRVRTGPHATRRRVARGPR